MSHGLRVVAVVIAIGMLWSAAGERALATSRLPLGAVVHGAVLTQAFGCTSLVVEPFDPYCPTRHFHSGVDLAAPQGTPVYAATGGRAVSAFDANGAGLFVAVNLGDHVRILYCHLHRAAVSVATVSAGQLIGEVGSTGLATGAHLHFEIQVDGRAVDPVRWLAAS